VVNAASFQPTITLGSLATIFGTRLVDPEGVFLAEGYPLPTELGGTRVFLNETPCPLLMVAKVNGREQINFQVPWRAGDDGRTFIVVERNGQRGYAETGETAKPAFFVRDGLVGIFQHASDHALVTLERPAEEGELLIGWGTGFGPLRDPPAAGEPTPDTTLFPLDPQVFPRLTDLRVDGQLAEVLFGGLAPRQVGVYQINFRVPRGVSSGLVNVDMRNVGVGGGNTVKLPMR
jgi:uncharacterized protein (TIGR03437 family)